MPWISSAAKRREAATAAAGDVVRMPPLAMGTMTRSSRTTSGRSVPAASARRAIKFPPGATLLF
ncbi:hypothetical protein ABTZ59_28025 [Streptomyces sp. NPDC094034]|uniref:hypothetical protein n=1 Tax=Streptomyces sp. NPDC094034 TaxID=3155309 RepID=UPI00331C7029